MMEDKEEDEMEMDFSHSSVLGKYSETVEQAEKIVEVWLDKVRKGKLTPANFKEHWRVWVPKNYTVVPGSDLNLENEKSNDVLIDNLERFLANGGDFEEAMKKLNDLDNPPSVCGRVFKMGEPNYSCRECGMDSTCVLCVTCFQHSAHKNHNYKMGTSSGGGCCDCGDVEAWKNEKFCDIHLPGAQVKNDGNKKFPEDMAERCKVAFTGILKYAYQLLTLEHSPGLPLDLRDKSSLGDPLSLDSPDTFCTVLYNDEVHTFDEVINTLTKIVKCSQKDAIEYVTNIDREGRTVVRCTIFQQSQELKTDIERFTSKHGRQPLKVEVVHAHVVAHQYFAMKLLRWLQKVLSNSESFRLVFTDMALTPNPPDTSIVEGILLRDFRLWKSARTHWHRLFISGMLMEYSSKKALGKVFTRHYGSVMKDFIRDDHDHCFSIASLSVQIFTVPTLTHHLIAEEEVLFILLNTFLSECSRKYNRLNKLEFERNASTNQSFKRAQYILFDLKYLLSSKPSETQWTNALRTGFLQGFSLFLSLLACMQGMDLVTRQLVQHMEFEPEWESAFNLHIKLAQVITLVTEWCGSDKLVLVKAFRATLKKLHECRLEVNQIVEAKELADHSATCIKYDVSTQPVSIHLPLSRFLAGLYLHLEKHNLTFDSSEFQSTIKPSPEQIIEPILRTQVMIAQVHSGMWRRNGYSLMNQLYHYHNVRCRTEMLDRDIVMLQIGASLIQSDEFLIHLLNKFNLMNWADPDFEENSLKNPEEDSMRQTISLVEEFLGLIIAIVGERTVPGVGRITPDDPIKKEIMQQLCIKPLSHSELNRTLPDDVNHETGMERVIDDVATFKKPTKASGKGVYQLKPELYEYYNMFFYHYTREELSKSEEEQRKRRKHAGELECCPPPKLPTLTETFSNLPLLLQCDVMFHIVQTVLKRCVNLRARSFSEHQLQKVLHLIGYALQEEESKQYPYLLFSEKSTRWNIEKLIEELSTSARVESHRDMLTWTLKKFRQIKSTKEDAEMSCEPAENTSAERTGTSAEGAGKDSKEWRAKMAAEKRAKIMAQMAAMQKSFMKENAKLLEDTIIENKSEMASMLDLCQIDEVDPVCLGPNQTRKCLLDKTYTCILCQEATAVTADGRALVLSAFIQKSTVHANSRGDSEKPDDILMKPLFLPTSLRPQPHTSTCGHVMHSACWQTYFDNVLAKENRRPYRLRQPMSFDVEKQEFLCPLCECLSNTVLPLLPPLGSIKPNVPVSDITFEKFIEGLTITLKFKGRQQTSNAPISLANDDAHDTEKEREDETMTNTLFYTCPVDRIQNEMGETAGPLFSALFPQEDPPVLSQSLVDMILHFAQTTYTKGLSVNPSVNSFVPVMAWNTCYYTILSIESLLADQDKPLLGMLSSRQRDCLESLTRFSGVLGAVWKRAYDISNHALFLLAMLLEGNSKNEESPCLLDWDSFGLLVPLTLSLPNLFCSNLPGAIPSGGVLELYLLKLIFLSHVTRILLTTKFQSGEMEMEMESDDAGNKLSAEEAELLLGVLQTIKSTCNYNVVDVRELDADYIWSTVKRSCMPFLRCSALFYHFLTDVPYPNSLAVLHGDTYENLCKYLGLPLKVTELFESPKCKELMTTWLTHQRIPGYLSTETFIRLPRTINGLVTLPDDYSELINMVSTFTCPNSDREDSRNPTMCLVCGEMLCSQSYCCQQELNKISVGACTYHAHRCGANCGIFLRVRECEILLLATTSRGCFLSAPYLDRYGETDPGLRRGNPLTLCPERYRKLKFLWLSHGLHEEIARSIESSSSVISTQWQHL